MKLSTKIALVFVVVGVVSGFLIRPLQLQSYRPLIYGTLGVACFVTIFSLVLKEKREERRAMGNESGVRLIAIDVRVVALVLALVVMLAIWLWRR